MQYKKIKAPIGLLAVLILTLFSSTSWAQNPCKVKSDEGYVRVSRSAISADPGIAYDKALLEAQSALAGKFKVALETVAERYVSENRKQQKEDVVNKKKKRKRKNREKEQEEESDLQSSKSKASELIDDFEKTMNSESKMVLRGYEIVCEEETETDDGDYRVYIALELKKEEIVEELYDRYEDIIFTDDTTGKRAKTEANQKELNALFVSHIMEVK